MKTTILILLMMLPIMSFGNNETNKAETKKEVIYEKSSDLINIDTYIKSLKLKRTKTVRC